ncbi:MAG: flagellar motor protein [Gammaproteobacteria bacterium]|nr:flagellar motor protein [Gammaproteobacteria bacterium]MDJ0890333.1 flagellar motor protein [Gammaproteobacteria bacterium]
MDKLSVIGVIVGIGAILVGQQMEGGHLDSLVNGPAILIVFGGTIGAVMVQSPVPTFMRALQIAGWVVRPPVQPVNEIIEKIVSWSQVARREGLLGLESQAEDEPDPFARKGLQLLVDGNEPDTIRSTMELENFARESRDMAAAKVFDGLGGYSPTIGIIGAVLGLIHVMGNLADPSKLGPGIATAFVATIYGVGLANLLFLPIGNKLKAHVQNQSQYGDMLIEGIIAIAEGENPMNIELRLQGYLA